MRISCQKDESSQGETFFKDVFVGRQHAAGMVCWLKGLLLPATLTPGSRSFWLLNGHVEIYLLSPNNNTKHFYRNLMTKSPSCCRGRKVLGLIIITAGNWETGGDECTRVLLDGCFKKKIQTYFVSSTSEAERIRCIWLQLPLHFCNLISLRCIMSNNYLNEDSNGRWEENNRDALKKWSCKVALFLTWHWFISPSASRPYRGLWSASLSKITCFRHCLSDGFFHLGYNTRVSEF